MEVDDATAFKCLAMNINKKYFIAMETKLEKHETRQNPLHNMCIPTLVNSTDDAIASQNLDKFIQLLFSEI